MVQKHILAIINPKSGSGKSVKIFNKKIEPKIKHLKLIKFIPETKKEYINYLQTSDLSIFNRFIIVGGDGTIHDFINTVDQKYHTIPIAIVPTGSGNAMAKSLGISNVDDSLQSIMKDEIQNVNLQELCFNNEKKYSFLNTTWTMISDIDIGTEFLRFMGFFRYIIGILKFIILNKYVQGKLIYNIDGMSCTREGKFCFFCASGVKWLSDIFPMFPYAVPNDKKIDLLYINQSISLFDRLKLLYYCLKGTHVKNCEFISYARVDSFSLTETDKKKSSYIVCDGEVVPSKSIVVHITDKQIKFLTNL